MGKEYVPIFFDWLDTTQDLTPEEKGNLIDAVVAYASGKEYEHLLTGGCKIAFRFLKGQVDRNAAISDARSKAGSSKKEQHESDGSNGEQNETNENKPEQNETKSVIEKENNKEKENKKQEREQKQEVQARFDRFWSEYPRHEGKQNAIKAFQKINPDDELTEIMIRAVQKQKTSAQWQENGGQYIPHPATWLNGRRWEDEVQPQTGKTIPAQQYEQRDYTSAQDEIRQRMLEMMRVSA